MDAAHGMLCIWPITVAAFTRDDLIGQARERLDQVAADTGARVLPGSTTWLVLDADDLDGWQDWRTWDLTAIDRTLHGDWTSWTGQLLAAVVPAEPEAVAGLAAAA
jgi:hypothetical protein